jgi:hypothetical protein
MQYIEFQIDQARLQSLIAGVQNFGWLYEWGMFFFLFMVIAATAWIFIDSTQKHRARKALIPRIVCLVGFFLVLPAFIFRYTGNADAVNLKVKLLGELNTPFYSQPIPWNVKWLVAGSGSMIAILAMVGMIVAMLAAIIYASTVNRSRPSTEFIGALNNQFGQLRQEIQSVKSRSSVSTSAPTVAPGSVASSAAPAAPSRSAATVIDRAGAAGAATMIDRPGAGSLRVVSGSAANRTWQLPQSDVSIGRDTTNFVAIDDAKSSREHAKIRFADGIYSLLDLGSSNGTYLNDRKVAGQTPLSNGDQIRIGDTVFAFSVGS